MTWIQKLANENCSLHSPRRVFKRLASNNHTTIVEVDGKDVATSIKQIKVVKGKEHPSFKFYFISYCNIFNIFESQCLNKFLHAKVLWFSAKWCECWHNNVNIIAQYYMLFNKLFILKFTWCEYLICIFWITMQIKVMSKYQCASYECVISSQTKDNEIIIITKSKYSWIITHYLVNCLFLQFNSSLTTNRTGYRLTVM